ncbi:MAG: dTDP-4-dehydrorhamnose reductase [Bacteroidales bacterium]|nr:dTDP-4-dehydrorhamnose reductase [Bacteroidales bacterium]
MNTSNILVSGSNGQLGSEIRTLSEGFEHANFFFMDLPEMDICNEASVTAFVKSNQINVIINCAAYTAVDKAEEDKENAFEVNKTGVGILAQLAKEHNILLIHVSTDYVFNGQSFVPYKESDGVNPMGVYGQSKWEGEELIRQIAPSYMIIRTSWLYSSFGNNFVKTMLRLGNEREQLGVIFDQVGTPTYARDLAASILSIVTDYDSSRLYHETYHFSNEGVCSWYDFARTIFDLRDIECIVNPIETKDYPTLAKRPHYSVLNKSSIKADWNIQIPHWKDSLQKCLELV